MKILILTQPLGHNYGGILQAYALQRYLMELGFSVETLDNTSSENFIFRINQYIRNIVRLIFGRIKALPSTKRKQHAYQNIAKFRNDYIKMTPNLTSGQYIAAYCNKQSIDAIIVGSDQVWRPRYSPNIYNYFLDFIGEIKKPTTTISYAASFGVDRWEFSDTETVTCGKLVKNFDGISVREDSAVQLCQKHLHRDASWVIDPTLLLKKEAYSGLFKTESQTNTKGKLLSYLLDPTPMKKEYLQSASTHLGVNTFSVKPAHKITDVSFSDLDKCVYPKVEDWLRSFDDASFVVTDSFHGCVFSIIFKKPFIAIGNKERGLGRFNSLLGLFGLKNRLISGNTDNIKSIIDENIDWSYVEKILNQEQGKAKKFLLDHLNSNK